MNPDDFLVLDGIRRRRVLLSGIFASDPGTGGYTLPRGMAITCATTGRTSQTSASTLRTGIGANAARGRSVNGATWGLACERAATNRLTDSNPGVWSVGSATTTPIAGPDGNTSAGRVVDVSASTGDAFTFWQNAPTGQPGTVSIWMANWAKTSGAATGALFESLGGQGVYRAGPFSSWAYLNNTTNYTQASSNAVAIPTALSSSTFEDVSQAQADYAFGQLEDGSYPTSCVISIGAPASRAADVLSLSSPSTIAPGGYFDLSLAVAPHYATAEQAADHNLLYFDANNRLFLRQSDAKLVLRLGGANNTVSPALTWSRETPLRIRARHTPREQVLEVLGATSGNGVASASAAAAISLPATAYLLGSNTGSEECASLYAVQFQRPL